MRIVALALLIAAATGCATVRPYERSVLMSRVMQDPVDPLEAGFDAHVFGTREAMTGATTTGGASCGCL